MLIKEFTNLEELKEVDLPGDLLFFMQNDSQFYRKTFYPAIMKFKKHIDAKTKCKDTIFRSCVDQACEVYCKQFELPGNSKSVFTDVDRDSIARTIFGQEIDRIQSGVYDRKEQ